MEYKVGDIIRIPPELYEEINRACGVFNVNSEIQSMLGDFFGKMGMMASITGPVIPALNLMNQLIYDNFWHDCIYRYFPELKKFHCTISHEPLQITIDGPTDDDETRKFSCLRCHQPSDWGDKCKHYICPKCSAEVEKQHIIGDAPKLGDI